MSCACSHAERKDSSEGVCACVWVCVSTQVCKPEHFSPAQQEKTAVTKCTSVSTSACMLLTCSCAVRWCPWLVERKKKIQWSTTELDDMASVNMT